MGAGDWLDLTTIQAVCKHVSAALTSIVAFSIVGIAIHFALRDGLLKQILELVDGFVLVGLFGILGWKLLFLAWRSDGARCIVAV